MNFRRSLLIWTLVLGAVAGLIYWDSVQTVIDEKEKENKGKIFSEEFANVTEFTLNSTGDDGAVTDISGKLTEAGWTLTGPTTAKADATQIESMVKAVLDYKHDRVISENSQDAAKFGLEKPNAKLTLRTKSSSEIWLAVGEKTPVGYSTYVTTSADSRILLGSQHIQMAIKKTLKDLRDKTLLDLQEGVLSRFAVTSRSAKPMKYEVTRMNDTLTVRYGTLQDKADSKKVGALLNAFRDNKIEDFNDAPPAKLLQALQASKEGLSMDWVASTGTQLSVQIAKFDGKVWAKRSDSPTAFAVPEKIITDLTATFFDLRDKTLLSFSANELVSVELDGKTFNRSEEGKWTEATNGEEPKFDLAGLVVDLSFLAPSDIADFKQKNALIKPVHSLSFKFAEAHSSKSGKFTLFEEKTKDKTRVWVRYEPSQPSEKTAGISEKLFEASATLLNNLKEKTESSVPSGTSEEKQPEALDMPENTGLQK